MNPRYWNGHQWKDLPVPEAIASDVIVEISVEAPVAVEPAAVDPAAATAKARTASGPAFVVPTHTEYGDVFTAEQPKVDG